MAMQRKRRRRSSGNNNGNVNPNKHFESNGPDVRIRGSAQQILDKYLQYARDAQTSGDRVKAEALFQHAEHYARIVAEFEKQKEAARAEREAREAQKAEERAQREAEREAEREAANADENAETIPGDEDSSPEAAPDPLKVIDAEVSDDGDVKADSDDQPTGDEKPKRRRRTYTRKKDEGAPEGEDGVLKTLSRGVEEAPAE
ncbi:MAG: DUF4167 domain-containing protein [Pseudomonadota bacterium]